MSRCLAHKNPSTQLLHWSAQRTAEEEQLRQKRGVQKFTPTAIFPHVWKAVKINIKEAPKMTTLKSFLDSGDILCFLAKSSASVWKKLYFLSIKSFLLTSVKNKQAKTIKQRRPIQKWLLVRATYQLLTTTNSPRHPAALLTSARRDPHLGKTARKGAGRQAEPAPTCPHEGNPAAAARHLSATSPPQRQRLSGAQGPAGCSALAEARAAAALPAAPPPAAGGRAGSAAGGGTLGNAVPPDGAAAAPPRCKRLRSFLLSPAAKWYPARRREKP